MFATYTAVGDKECAERSVRGSHNKGKAGCWPNKEVVSDGCKVTQKMWQECCDGLCDALEHHPPDDSAVARDESQHQHAQYTCTEHAPVLCLWSPQRDGQAELCLVCAGVFRECGGGRCVLGRDGQAELCVYVYSASVEVVSVYSVSCLFSPRRDVQAELCL